MWSSKRTKTQIVKKWPLAGVLLGTVLLSACGGSSNNSPQAQLRVIHASGNAPAVNVKVDGSEAVPNLAFATATSKLSLAAREITVSVDAILPNEGALEVVGDTPLMLNANEITTVIASGDVGSESEAFGPQVIVTPVAEVAADQTRVQVVHASAKAQRAASAVDVYVTAPTANLDDDGVAPLVTFSLKEATDAITVPSGEVRVRITPENAPESVVFDSGTINLPGGADLMILAIDSFGPGSPVRLLVSTGDAESDFIIVDDTAPTEARVVHAASGVGPAEVFASSVTADLTDAELIDSFEYRTTEDLPNLPAVADYTLKVNVADGGAADPAIQAEDVALDKAVFYTVLAAGDLPVSGAADLTLLATADDRRSVATEARVRAIHAASLAGTVALFVTPAGEVTAQSIELGEQTPTVPSFAYQDISDYLSLAAGSNDVRVAVPAQAGFDVAIDATGVELNAGDVVSLIATNPEDGGSFEFVISSEAPAPF